MTFADGTKIMTGKGFWHLRAKAEHRIVDMGSFLVYQSEVRWYSCNYLFDTPTSLCKVKKCKSCNHCSIQLDERVLCVRTLYLVLRQISF